MAAEKKSRVWIIDGHNLIFQVPHLKDLQVSGRRTEARRELEQLLLAFANERQEEVVIVYDGNSQQGNPDTLQERFLSTTYSLGFPDEVADHRILYLARERGNHHRVSVVTSDVRTLAKELDRSVTHLSVGEFWSRHISAAPPAGSKEVTGDFSDIEAEFLRRERLGEPAPAPTPPRSASATAASPPPPAAQKQQAPSDKPALGPSEKQQEQLRLKRERGRLRQARRLAGRRRER